MDYDESRSLRDELLAHTTRPEHVYQHRWHAWALVMWDTRCVLHRGRRWDATLHRRVMRRTTVAGEGPTADPPFASRSVAWDGIIPEGVVVQRSEEHTSELQSPCNLVCRLLLEKKKNKNGEYTDMV